MRLLIVAAGSLALVACASEPATEEDPTVADTISIAVEGAGTFDYAAEDGSVSGQVVMNEDGTFTDTEDNGTVRTGTWSADGGRTCFTESTEGATEVCWTDSEPAEDGTFTSTSPEGLVVKVTPVTTEGEAAAE